MSNKMHCLHIGLTLDYANAKFVREKNNKIYTQYPSTAYRLNSETPIMKTTNSLHRIVITHGARSTHNAPNTKFINDVGKEIYKG